jgi:hypothetical protein
MAKITRVEILQVDLPPKVVRTDAIQSFVTQETPMVRRHHVIDAPQSRGLLINLRTIHTTAVIQEKASGRRWSVDGWTRNNGEVPDIFPIEEWAKMD